MVCTLWRSVFHWLMVYHFFHYKFIHEWFDRFRCWWRLIHFVFIFVLLCRCVWFLLLTKLFVGCSYFGCFYYLHSLFVFVCHNNQPTLGCLCCFCYLFVTYENAIIPWIGILRRSILDYNRDRRSCVIKLLPIKFYDWCSTFTCHCLSVWLLTVCFL